MAGGFCIQSKKMGEFIDENFDGINAPFTAGIELTAKCNLNCIHCYANHDRIHTDISTVEVKNIIDTLVDRGLLEVFFTGGEILTRPDFEEIYIYTKKKGVAVVLLSNITLLTQRHIDLFIEYPVELISTTMYGYSEEIYEKITSVRGSYKKFMHALELLKENGITFELKFVGMKQNIEDVYKVRKLGNSLGVNMIIGLDIRPMNDGTLEPMNYRISPKEAFEFDIKDDGRNAFWKNIAREIYEERTGLRPKKKRNRFEEGFLYPCSIGKQFVFITSDYKMQGCIKASHKQYDLKAGSFDEGWRFLYQELSEKKASPFFPCTSCEKSLFCEQCTANFALEYGNEESIDNFYCQIADMRKNFVEEEISRISMDMNKPCTTY